MVLKRGGGFNIMLNETDIKNTYIIAEKIRRQLEYTTFQYVDISINTTSSFGAYNVTDYHSEFSKLLSKVIKPSVMQKTVVEI